MLQTELKAIMQNSSIVGAGGAGFPSYAKLADGAEHEFCVEKYLTGPSTEVYQTCANLAAGDVVDIEGFLYWYEGPQPHVTKVTVK